MMKTLLLLTIFIPIAHAKLAIDKSCFDDPYVKGQQLSKEKIYENLKHNLDIATQSIFWCEYKYPAIKKYTREWREVAKHFRVTCEKADGYASAIYDNSKLRFIKGEEDIIGLRSIEAKGLLTNKFKNSYVKAVSTLIHEIFHGTSANISIDKHNELERQKPKDDCNQSDSVHDKVSVLDSLCSNGVLNSSSNLASYEIFKKIRRCGIKKGCVDIFTQELGTFDTDRIFDRSEALDEATALNLCNDIYLKGACEGLESGGLEDEEELIGRQKLQLFRENKKLKKAISILKRYKKDIPTSNFLPMSFIRKNPSLNAGLKALKNSVCFKEVIKVSESGVSCKNPKYNFDECFWDSSWREGNIKDHRCSLKSSYAVKSWLKSAVGTTSKGIFLDTNYDEVHDLIELKSVPLYFFLDQLFKHDAFKRIFSKKDFQMISSLLKKHYPLESGKSCIQVQKDDIKLLIKVLDKIPRDFPNIKTYCSEDN